jgi:hypothetical protein
VSRKADLLGKAFANITRAAAQVREAGESELADDVRALGQRIARLQDMLAEEPEPPLATGPDVLRKG